VSVAEDAVRFRFAWPSNVHADVAWTNHVVDDSYGETKDTTYTFRFEIVARPLADGIRIDQRTSLAQGLQSVASLLSSGSGGSIQHWLFFYPSFSVGTDGQFRGLEQVEAYRASMEAMLADGGKDAKRLTPEQVEQVRALARRNLSPEVIGAKVAADWNTVITAWNGGKLVPGQVLELTTTLQYTIGGQVLMVPRVERYRLFGYVPCDAHDARNRCVDVEAAFVPDADAMRVMYDRAIAESMPVMMLNRREPPHITSAFIQSTVRMITDPRTLLPYRVQFIDELHLQFAEPEHPNNRKSEITLEFNYRS